MPQTVRDTLNERYNLDEPLWNILEYERLAHDDRARELTTRLVLTHTTGLTGEQWGAVIGLSILPSIVVEFEKTHRGTLLRMSRLKK